MAEKKNLTILVAPLDWGLGHATRCIPIIKHLLQLGCKVIIAAEGLQENLLKTEFPDAAFIHLPGYRMRYTKSKRLLQLKIVLQLPKILVLIRREKKWLRCLLQKQRIDGVISDGRYGLHHPAIPCVIMTHQLSMKAPVAFAENLMQKFNYHFIRKFTACWVPDEEGPCNLAGDLSHPRKMPGVPVHYLGCLSRLEQQAATPKYKALILLSGPEPQRSILEKKVAAQLESYNEPVLLLRGLPNSAEELHVPLNVVVKNHLSAHELQQAFAESEYVISRSGYTTVMDVCKLRKKSILIPTPGQTEQEYLAEHLHVQQWCLAIEQDQFSLREALNKAEKFNYRLPELDMNKYKEVVETFPTL